MCAFRRGAELLASSVLYVDTGIRKLQQATRYGYKRRMNTALQGTHDQRMPPPCCEHKPDTANVFGAHFTWRNAGAWMQQCTQVGS